MGHSVMDLCAWQEERNEEGSFAALRMTANGGAMKRIGGGGAGSRNFVGVVVVLLGGRVDCVFDHGRVQFGCALNVERALVAGNCGRLAEVGLWRDLAGNFGR